MFKHLAQLPRESRDTLFLLTVVGWISLPHATHLPLWCQALAAGVLAWHSWLALAQRPLPGRWIVFLVLALAVGATAYTYRSLLGQEAGSTLLVALFAIKTLELRARRDALVVCFFGFFVMLANFLYSQSLLNAASMLLGLLGLLAALVNSHLPAGRPPLGLSVHLAGQLMLLGAPLMLLLFLLFPRLGPLWGIPDDGLSGRSGLSSRMHIGHIARLALDDGIALRVRFEGAPPPAPDLYFRGPVLSTFDGREWLPLQASFLPRQQPPANLQVSGTPLRYEVTLEPHHRPWLLTLDATPRAPELPGLTARMTRELQWQANTPIREPLRYRAQAHPQFRHGPLQPVASLQDYLALPAGFNPRTRAWGEALRRDPQLPDSSAKINAALTRLREGGYRYTLEPGVTGPHSADEFWFDRKLGFCEHIASAFVILMRAAGIPARIVTGYQGGERNAIDGFWVVRQSDAHAWAEVWVPVQGWLRVDPTAAVAPTRIGALQRLHAPAGVMASALGAVSPGLLLQWRALWEATNNHWNQWVLNYSQGQQRLLLQQFGFTTPHGDDLGLLLLGSLVLASLLGAVWLGWQRQRLDPWLRLLARAQERLRAAGVVLPAQAPPREMARCLMEQRNLGDNRVQALHDWLLRLEAQRYAPPTPDHTHVLSRLRREFRQLNPLT
jgi:transglutaminase-like putative cysteine protease